MFIYIFNSFSLKLNYQVTPKLRVVTVIFKVPQLNNVEAKNALCVGLKIPFLNCLHIFMGACLDFLWPVISVPAL